MDYEGFFADKLSGLKDEGCYRTFADLERHVGQFPAAKNFRDGASHDITIWCSNDYLGMGMHPVVLDAMTGAVRHNGAGAGGTRNISGTHHYHVLLEQELASWHNMDAALLFTSGYVANMTTLMTLGAKIPELVIFSDSENHNSMIEGIRHSRAPREIFRHNDLEHLEELLAKYPKDHPKLIAFESVYSMDGDIAPIEGICDLADKYNAMTYLDEVHAVGMYGETGSGVAERDGVRERLTIIQATMGKALGVVGGYIVGSANVVDFVRSFGAGFIFTTSLPPAVAAGALESIRYLRNHNELRERHQERAETLKRRLREVGIPAMASVSHIVPVLVGDEVQCKLASDLLLRKHDIYVQPIVYPTVPRGMARLRLTPTPLHTDEHMDHLITSMVDVWNEAGIDKQAAAAA